jgi:hypothetical protein
MVRLKYIVLSFLTTIFVCCGVIQANQINDYKRVSGNINLKVMISQDTIVLGDEIFVTLIFKNKTDTCFYFHPEALLYIDIYTSPENWNRGANAEVVVHYLSIPNKYSIQNNLILLKPKEVYSKTYHVQLNRPLLRFGNNKLVLKYMCSNGIQKYEQKREYEILYGGLESSVFEIYVKENNL